jgi:exodeoxyribonuclease VII large subunit
MRNDGLGDLYLQFELLKKKLFEAGLFSDERKKPIPSYPKSIGIITGRETAALQDMLKTMTLRWPIVEVTIYPSLVQGDQAPRNIIEQLIKADRNQHNVLILARGGGSIEDLWAFNNEQLAYTIEALKTPLITGVGHETDTTIADLVADLRAATPTAAVQLAVPDIQEVEQSVHNQLKRLNQIIDSELNKQRVALRQVQTHPVFTQPHRLMMSHQLQLSNYEQQLSQQTKRAHRLRVGLSTQQSQLSQRILSFTNNQTVRLARSQDLLIKRIEQKTLNSQNAFGQTLKLLNAFSPLNSLARGYSIVSQEDKVIRLINDIDYDREMKIRLFDGTVRAKAMKEQSDE